MNNFAKPIVLLIGSDQRFRGNPKGQKRLWVTVLPSHFLWHTRTECSRTLYLLVPVTSPVLNGLPRAPEIQIVKTTTERSFNNVCTRMFTNPGPHSNWRKDRLKILEAGHAKLPRERNGMGQYFIDAIGSGLGWFILLARSTQNVNQ